MYEADTEFALPARASSGRGRPRSVVRADREPASVPALAAALPSDAWQTLVFGESPAGEPRQGRFACLRIFAAGDEPVTV